MPLFVLPAMGKHCDDEEEDEKDDDEDDDDCG